MEELLKEYDRLHEEARAALDTIRAAGLDSERDTFFRYMMAAVTVINNQKIALDKNEDRLNSATTDQRLYDEILTIVKQSAMEAGGKKGGKAGTQYDEYRKIVAQTIAEHDGDRSQRGFRAGIIKEANSKAKIVPSERRAWQIVQEEIAKSVN